VPFFFNKSLCAIICYEVIILMISVNNLLLQLMKVENCYLGSPSFSKSKQLHGNFNVLICFFFFLISFLTPRGGEGEIQTSDLHSMRRGPQLIELLLRVGNFSVLDFVFFFFSF
jgi:hypothetical protein